MFLLDFSMSSKDSRRSKRNIKNLPVSTRCVAIVFKKVENDSVDISESCKLEINDGSLDRCGLDRNLFSFTKPCDSGSNNANTQDAISKTKGQVTFDAKKVFDEFKLRNKTCYWNPALVDSVSALEYAGFLEPTTILVRGDDVHLENVRTAWGRRVLKDPAHFIIHSIGTVQYTCI